MITADALATLTTFSTKSLERALAVNGYAHASFKTSEFVGITNGGQFAYKATYYDDVGTGKDQVCQVFLTYDAGTVTADY